MIDGDRGKNYPKQDEFTEDGFCLFLNAKNVTDNGFNFETKMFISQEKDEILKKGKLQRGDVILTTRGTVGNVAFYSENIPFDNIRINSGMLILRSKSELSNKFLYYVLKSDFFKKQIYTFKSGTAQPQLPISSLNHMKFYLPKINIQKKIVTILSNIDKKIKVLEEINKNLDKLCHSLFKYYFIDFIPFCDDDFIDSDIGEIPKEWSITTVGNILDCKLGGTPSRSNESYWGGSIAWINSGKVNDFRIIEPSEYITEKGLKKSATKLLPAKTTVIAITGATLGQISLLEIDSCANQSVIGIIPNINYPYEFVYPLISSILIDLLKHQTGGAQQHINKNNVESFKIICPPAEIISEYKTIVSPIYSKISDNCFEIEKLQKLRDTLLPKLMSGEIDVSKINCDLKIIIRKIYIKSSKLFLWRYLSENQNYIKNTKSNETLLKSRTIYQINKFLAKFNARYRYYRQ